MSINVNGHTNFFCLLRLFQNVFSRNKLKKATRKEFTVYSWKLRKEKIPKSIKARFKRRTFHVPNLIPIWVDPNN